MIVVGHSLWFRSYFQTFLPADVKVGGGGGVMSPQHLPLLPSLFLPQPSPVAAEAKKLKMSNGGVVAFDVVKRTVNVKGALKDVFMILPDSVEVVHGKFKKG